VLPARAGQTAFTTLSSAISWLYGENKYFLSNQNYPQIVTDGLSFIVDAGFAASYPNAGTSTYDLGVQQFTNTMQNGLVWTNNNTKSYFDFDGADDQIVINSPNNFSNITWSAGMTVQVLYKFDAVTDFNGQFRAMLGTDSSPRSFNYYLYGANNPATTLTYHFSAQYSSSFADPITISADKYHLATFRINSSAGTYLHNLTTITNIPGATPAFYTGPLQFLGRADNLWKGNIASWKIYNKSLSDNEIAQNYYQGPIVTTNLSYLWDAGNLISYYTGSSTTYDMLNTGVNGTLQNGVGYSGNYGGYWSFDGTDDRILLTNSLYSFTIDANTNWTVNAWVRTGTSANGLGNGSVMSNSNGGPVYSMLGINNGRMTYWHYNGTWLQSSGNVIVNDNQWHLLTWVNKSNSTMDMYVDGVLDVSNVNSSLSSNNWIDIIGASWAATFAGDIGSVQVNKGTAMDVSQVTQQYGATRGRFQSYQAYANGGTVTTLTQNGVNYRVHTFTSSGTLSVTQSGSVEVLVVAGGGGGGNNHAGGGGAGGLIFDNSYYVINNQSIAVTIGAGGTSPVLNTSPVTNGNNSVFGTLTAIGGGGGGSRNDSNNNSPGNNGGSGGGGGGSQDIYTGNHVPGNGTSGQGNNGGYGINILGGGGGGASAVGTVGAYNSTGGNGGNGIQFNLNGTSTYYAGGGGGGYNPLYGGGNGGLGGGGNGGIQQFDQGTPGTANTGGGGGGGGAGGTQGSIGGSGIVIVRYPIY
jgi:hypothetical protein